MNRSQAGGLKWAYSGLTLIARHRSPAAIAQLVERILGKDKAAGPIPALGS